MAFPRNSKSALLALLTAGGIWAWQNRDKVASWVGQISERQPGHRKSFADQVDSSAPSPTLEAYTGGTRRIDAEDKSAGGIIIPDSAKEKPSQGEIIAVGPGGRDESGKLIPIDLKVGDTVLFGKWSGTEVKIDGQDLLIMKESDIMGVVEGTSSKRKAA